MRNLYAPLILTWLVGYLLYIIPISVGNVLQTFLPAMLTVTSLILILKMFYSEHEGEYEGVFHCGQKLLKTAPSDVVGFIVLTLYVIILTFISCIVQFYLLFLYTSDRLDIGTEAKFLLIAGILPALIIILQPNSEAVSALLLKLFKERQNGQRED